MINSKSFKPGRVYSVIYNSNVELVGKRDFPVDITKPNGATFQRINPLDGIEVTVRRVSTVQAAGNVTWSNLQRKINPDWQPSSERKSWYNVTPENSCIVQHNTQGTRYLRALPRGITKEEYLIDGIPATPNELQTIQDFRRSTKETNFVLLKLDNLVNVQDDGGMDE